VQRYLLLDIQCLEYLAKSQKSQMELSMLHLDFETRPAFFKLASQSNPETLVVH